MSADAVPTDHPAEEPTERPTEQLAEHPAEPAADQSTEPPAHPPVEQLAEPTGEPPAEQPGEQLAEPPVEQPGEQLAEPPVEQPGEQLAEPPVEPPAEQPGEQLAEPPFEPAVDQSTEPPADPPGEQLPEQPAGASEPVALAAEGHVPESPTPADDDDRSREPLVPESFGFESRWDAIQAGFVDEPRRSVAEADALVAEVIDEISAAFAGVRAALEEQWSEGGEASTEDLRQAFRRYRSFFQRLLSA
jgi:hypothetical protein